MSLHKWLLRSSEQPEVGDEPFEMDGAQKQRRRRRRWKRREKQNDEACHLCNTHEAIRRWAHTPYIQSTLTYGKFHMIFDCSNMAWLMLLRNLYAVCVGGGWFGTCKT